MSPHRFKNDLAANTLCGVTKGAALPQTVRKRDVRSAYSRVLRKPDPNPFQPACILTETRVGYRHQP
ncbi:MAG: hypothetical protein KJ634_10760 [Gammaproteobacteria bacterium]|nr:hypothetical protein [Gammaproteobacteria bacterium]MBU1416093.1 hypothetical protein [Gammaproteobacteria bacterium]